MWRCEIRYDGLHKYQSSSDFLGDGIVGRAVLANLGMQRVARIQAWLPHFVSKSISLLPPAGRLMTLARSLQPLPITVRCSPTGTHRVRSEIRSESPVIKQGLRRWRLILVCIRCFRLPTWPCRSQKTLILVNTSVRTIPHGNYSAA